MTNESATLGGIHHVTAIASDPQQNVDFYYGLARAAVGEAHGQLRRPRQLPPVLRRRTRTARYGDDVLRVARCAARRAGTGERSGSPPFDAARVGRLLARTARGSRCDRAERRGAWATACSHSRITTARRSRSLGRDGDSRPGWAHGPVPADRCCAASSPHARGGRAGTVGAHARARSWGSAAWPRMGHGFASRPVRARRARPSIWCCIG